MLDEKAYRREGIDLEHSVPIRLADGQEWYFPKPWIAIRPVFVDGKAVSHARYPTHGPELDALIDLVGAADSLAGQVVAMMGLAAHLLLRNYDLTDAELGEVLVYRPGDPACEASLTAIIEVATGRSGKKPMPAGGA